MEFSPVMKSNASDETRLADEEKRTEEERSRRETDYLQCLVSEGEAERCENLRN